MNPLAVTPLSLALCLVSSALGANEPPNQVDPQPDLQPESSHPFVFEAHTQALFVADSDFDDEIGEFQYNKIAAGIKATRRIGNSGMLSIDFDAGLLNYEITPSASSVAGDAANIGAQFDDVTMLSLIATYAHRTDQGGTWFIGGGVYVGLENDADFGDSIDGMITGGYIYKINNNLELGMGIAMRTRLDDSVLVVPVPQIKYTINEYWSITGQGVGAKINYKASDSLNYGISGGYESTTFRLDGSHTLAPDGMVTHQRFPLAFYAQYQSNDTIEISGRIGGLLASELEILDTNGNDLTRQDIDTGIFGALTVSFRF